MNNFTNVIAYLDVIAQMHEGNGNDFHQPEEERARA